MKKSNCIGRRPAAVLLTPGGAAFEQERGTVRSR